MGSLMQQIKTNITLDAFISAMHQRDIRTFQEFAEQEIVIPDGRYKNRKYSADVMRWNKLLLDEYQAGKYVRYFLTGPRQTGKTVLGFMVPVLYHLFEMEEDVIVGVPKIDLAQSIWKKRLLPIIQKTKYRNLIPKRGAGSKGGKFEEITFGNGVTLRFLSKGMSYTARVVVFTEIDYMDEGSETGREGSPMAQIEECCSSYGSLRRIYGEGITTIEDGAAHQEIFLNGTGTEIALQCRHCKAWITPERDGLIGWQAVENEKAAYDAARYVCPECQAEWTEDERMKALENPKFVHKGQTVEGDTVIGDDPDVFTFGLRWNRMHSSLTTMSDIASAEWRAQRSDDDDAMRAIFQYVWAMPYKEDLSAIPRLSYRNVLTKIGNYMQGAIPEGTEKITCAIDIGWYVCWCSVWAWRADTQGFCIDYQSFTVPREEEIKTKAILAALHTFNADVINQGWEDGRVHDMCFIDAQFESEAVWQFIRDISDARRYMGVQGVGTSDRNRWVAAPEGAKKGNNWWVNTQKNGMRMAHIHSDFWKESIQSGITTPAGSPGSLSVYKASDTDHLEFAKQIAAEQKEVSFGPGGKERVRWIRKGRKNHYFDTAYLSRAAADMIGVRLIPREKREKPQRGGGKGNREKYIIGRG